MTRHTIQEQLTKIVSTGGQSVAAQAPLESTSSIRKEFIRLQHGTGSESPTLSKLIVGVQNDQDISHADIAGESVLSVTGSTILDGGQNSDSFALHVIHGASRFGKTGPGAHDETTGASNGKTKNQDPAFFGSYVNIERQSRLIFHNKDALEDNKADTNKIYMASEKDDQLNMLAPDLDISTTNFKIYADAKLDISANKFDISAHIFDICAGDFDICANKLSIDVSGFDISAKTLDIFASEAGPGGRITINRVIGTNNSEITLSASKVMVVKLDGTGTVLTSRPLHTAMGNALTSNPNKISTNDVKISSVSSNLSTISTNVFNISTNVSSTNISSMSSNVTVNSQKVGVTLTAVLAALNIPSQAGAPGPAIIWWSSTGGVNGLGQLRFS